MRFQRGILALILIVGVIVLFWPRSVSQESAKPVDVSFPSVTAIEDFFQVPWGISRTEVLNLANASNLQPTPKGHFDYRGSSLIYRLSLQTDNCSKLRQRLIYRTLDLCNLFTII